MIEIKLKTLYLRHKAAIHMPCPNDASVLDYIDVDYTRCWDTNLSKRFQNCLNCLFILRIQKEAIRNAPSF